MNAVDLSIFASRLNAVCDEMGAVLQRAAFSPNIRDRLDFSCAVFNASGELCAQAAHIPVHLGSMAYAMQDIVSELSWQDGDMVIVNDPFLGGTHLPDVTVIAPVFVDSKLVAFVANRAHHADIGASSPGSMPISQHLEEEGLIIPPTRIVYAGVPDQSFIKQLTEAIRSGDSGLGDFAAQQSANKAGLKRLQRWVADLGIETFIKSLDELNQYGERLAHSALDMIPDGQYQFTDYMDDDGQGNRDIAIKVTITVQSHHIDVDFTGTAKQVSGNINCPLSVAAAAVYYVFRCLMPEHTPACAGTFRTIKLTAPEGCLVNAQRPAAVAAGNVETSTRIVDAVMGALAEAIPGMIPAASHGSMNNIAMGSNNNASQKAWDYYETIGGGMGAGINGGGLSAVQTHMTNTLNTPVEVLESHYPLRIKEYSIRRGSGGDGKRKGGDGIIRRYEFLQDATVTILSERRYHAPWGLKDGSNGKPGVNTLNGIKIEPKKCIQVKSGDVVSIETPGAGGFGKA